MTIKREDVPKGMHLAIPTRDNDTLHEGQYREHCEKCAAEAARLVQVNMPRHDGRVIHLGDAVRFKPEHLYSTMPEWATITTVRLNSHTGEVWMHAFAAGESLIITADMIMEVKPWEA